MALPASCLTKRLFAVAASLLLLLLLAVSAQAQHQVTTCGTTITESGEWTLVNNLNCVGVDGITISASNVTLNLNDHDLTGSSTNIGIHTLDHERIKIFGPSEIRGFSVGVLNERGNEVIVGNILVTGASVAGFVARDEHRLYWGVNGAEKNPVGFWLQSCKSCTLETNVALENIGDGFDIGGEDNRIADENQARENGAIGINVIAGAKGIAVLHCDAWGNSTFDMADQNPTCGSDTWGWNQFNTRNVYCIH